jgi:membrane-associated phospholipid phosphatase
VKKQNKTAERAVEKTVEKTKNKTPEGAHAKTAAKAGRRYRNRLLPFVLMLSIAVFFVLAFLARTTGVSSFDLLITRTLQSLNYPPVAWAMSLVSWIGYMPQVFIIMVINAMLLYGFGQRLEAFISLIASLLIQVLNILVKIVVHRPRPSADLVHVFNMLSGYSFPSGHVMFYTVFFGFNWFLTFTLLPHSWKRTLLLMVFGGLVLMIGVSRIYLGEHWASDVTGAYLLSGIVLTGVIQFYRWGKKRFYTT